MTTRILPDLILPSRANQRWTESGMDSRARQSGKQHFESYPHQIEYNYNSRGFRDAEWPDTLSELQDAVWVFGDSFTVGIGSPINHTWPYAVSQELNKRVINISMDGASNQWIARRVMDVYRAVQPSKIIVMWSYFHRRESADSASSDEDRRQHHAIPPDDTADIDDFCNCINTVGLLPIDCLHFTIPNAGPDILIYHERTLTSVWNLIKGKDWPDQVPLTKEEYQQLPQWIIEEINTLHSVDDYFEYESHFADTVANIQQGSGNHHYLGPAPQLDTARDGHHFDILSSHQVAATVGRQWRPIY